MKKRTRVILSNSEKSYFSMWKGSFALLRISHALTAQRRDPLVKKLKAVVFLGMNSWQHKEINDTVRFLTRAAAGIERLYINPPPGLKNTLKSLSSLTEAWHWQQSVENGIDIYTPPLGFAPVALGLRAKADRIAAKSFDRLLQSRYGTAWREQVLVYISSWSYTQTEFIRQLNPLYLVFHILDDSLAFPMIQNDPRVLAENHKFFRYIMERSSLVLAVSAELARKYGELYQREVAVVKNGVDVEHFRQSALDQSALDISTAASSKGLGDSNGLACSSNPGSLVCSGDSGSLAYSDNSTAAFEYDPVKVDDGDSGSLAYSDNSTNPGSPGSLGTGPKSGDKPGTGNNSPGTDNQDFGEKLDGGASKKLSNVLNNDLSNCINNNYDCNAGNKTDCNMLAPILAPINEVTENEVTELPQPVLMYVGSINSWVDLGLLLKLVNDRPNYSLVLIGHCYEETVDGAQWQELLSKPNVFWLKSKPYNQVPAYMHAAAVLLLPRTEAEHSRASDPLKLYEYLSAGKPVVSTGLPAVADFRELVYVAQNPTEFIQQVDLALSQPDPERPQQQYAVVKQHSWSARVKEISELLEKYLEVSLT
jgi:glycosyltransferase involved in cell wall biosynthesis